MGFRALHLADLHLETTFGGRPDTRERLRRATGEAFESAVDYAVDQRLHAVLAAGDLFDDPLLSLKTELELVRQVRRLSQAGVWFLYACGNHDPGAPGRRAATLGIESERVRVFRSPKPEAVTVLDREGQPVGVVVGAGHAGPAEGSNLAARFERVESPLPVIGLLHTHVASARSSAEHDRYAPSSDADFHRLDYSYWALGHIHARQRAVAELPVFYAGNLQGRNARETGEKGGLRVEAHPGAAAEAEFVRFGPVRWERLRVEDLPAVEARSTLLDHLTRRVAAVRRSATEEIAVRVELAGETPLARLLRSRPDLDALEEEVARSVGAVEVQLRDAGVALPIDRAAIRESPTVIAGALAMIERAAADDALLEELAPMPLARDLGGDEAARRAYLRELIEELPAELIERSLPGGGR
jgi:DNA repair exonuclease SbcCD nuclease subunit